MNKKAFFVNGGAGRVLCAIPALEHYVKNTDPEAVIVAESWIELFLSSPVLRNNVYPITHRNLFKDKLLDKELITLEPYRLNAYFTQKVNLIQAFDILVNDLKDIPETKKFSADIGKGDQVFGYNFVDQIRGQLQKDKTVVFQPFGSGAKQHGRFIIDESGRSFEIRDIIKIVEELGKHYAVILFSDIKIPVDKPMQAAVPDQLNLLQWMSVINASDYFLGCDSVGQHFANALNKPATVVIGSTYPENISYPGNKNFNIIDNGKDKREYSPIRITTDFFVERGNEDLMVLEDKTIDRIVKSVTDKLGKTKQKEQKFDQVVDAHVHSPSCSHGVQTPPFAKKQNLT
jgi:hypothetical protein